MLIQLFSLTGVVLATAVIEIQVIGAELLGYRSSARSLQVTAGLAGSGRRARGPGRSGAAGGVSLRHLVVLRLKVVV